MSQTVKANKTSNNRKTASAALAFALRLLARFFMQLSSRFWTIVSQRSQCDPEQLAQEEDEAREAQEARIRWDEEDRIRQVEEDRIRRDEEDRIRQVKEDRIRWDEEDRIRQVEEDRIRWDERLYREAAAHLITYERAKTLNYTAWVALEERNRGLDGPSIER
jgi:hypothetical protein